MKNRELILYCIQHMATKEHIHNFFTNKEIYFKKTDSYQKLASRIMENDNVEITIAELNDFFRINWKAQPSKLHFENLKSGKLTGHSWHGAMPSMLHMSMQNKVREHIKGDLDLDRLLQTGTDIMKHECFMVCVHDLVETMIIETFQETIPAIGNKSISDFVFNCNPYDLKITNYFDGYTKKYVNDNKEKIVEELILGADILRLRKQAEKTINNWGSNRFFVLVEDQNRWLEEPEVVIKELTMEIKKIVKPINVEIDGITITTQLIAI